MIIQRVQHASPASQIRTRTATEMPEQLAESGVLVARLEFFSVGSRPGASLSFTRLNVTFAQ